MGNRYTRKKIEFSINENGCYICTSHSHNKAGYPLYAVDGKIQQMSRFLWEYKNGPIPKRMHVCHKCDTPACINLEHFFLGTNTDNYNDSVNKGRAAKGERISKLLIKQVLEIRQDQERTGRELAKKYGVSPAQISLIKNRKVWTWL